MPSAIITPYSHFTLLPTSTLSQKTALVIEQLTPIFTLFQRIDLEIDVFSSTEQSLPMQQSEIFALAPKEQLSPTTTKPVISTPSAILKFSPWYNTPSFKVTFVPSNGSLIMPDAISSKEVLYESGLPTSLQ